MPQRKTILWVSHFLPFPAKGGAQIRSFNLIKELSQYHDVSLFCLVYEDVVTNYFDSLEAAISASEYEFKKYCKDLILIPIKRNQSKKIAFIKSLLSTKSYSVSRLNVGFVKHKLKEFIGSKQFDAIHLDTLSLCSLIDMFPEKNVVLNHHNIESLMMYRRAQEQSNILMKAICYLDAWKISNLERSSCAAITTHIVCSDLDGVRFKDLYPSINTITIPNGIDCSSVMEKRNSDGKTLLFIGGLDWYPNADAISFLLSKVWPIINERNANLTLDIIGKNPSSAIKELDGQFNNVKLHGFVDDIAPYYEKAWLYVCPIRDGGGTKLKVLDALAHGVPLVAHPVAMEGIDAISGVHYFQASTAQDFVNLILDLNSKSPDVLHEVGFSKYDYSRIGTKLAKIYE
jgi:glycosyltransferase involved in cell wall biosynthesis